MYQALILLVAFAVNFFNKFRQEYVLLIQGCQSASLSNVVPNNTSNSTCNSFEYSGAISGAVGFLCIGNLYDDVN
jgi:hypothetical protein